LLFLKAWKRSKSRNRTNLWRLLMKKEIKLFYSRKQIKLKKNSRRNELKRSKIN